MRKLQATWVLLPLGVAMAFLIITNPLVTYFDDEVAIINHATLPWKDLLKSSLHGIGAHEHPPLSDLLLAGWLPFCSDSLLLLRLPSMLFYVLGCFLMARSAMLLAGAGERFIFFASWWAALWPYGFLMGRAAGWYSLSFLLFNSIIYCYLKLVRGETKLAAAMILLTSVLLIYTNYFGLFLCALLGIDYFVFQNRTKRGLVVTIGFGIVLAVCYTPIWPVLIKKLGTHGVRDSLLSNVINIVYCFIATFTGESIAPWVWYLFLPIVIAISVLMLSLMRAKKLTVERRWVSYFVLSIIVLCAGGSLSTKRLLFFSAWLVIPLMSLLYRAPSRLIWVSLFVLLSISWVGMIDRSAFATTRYTEPWGAIAKTAADKIDSRESVGSTHHSFEFYLTYQLAPIRAKMKQQGYTRGVTDNGFFVPNDRKSFTPPSGRFHLFSPPDEVNVSTQGRPCVLESDTPIYVDPSAPIKQKWFPKHKQRSVRISHRIYQCE